MKIILFGVGAYYQAFKKIYSNEDEILYFIDNNPERWGEKIDEKIVYPPQQVVRDLFDYIILLSSKSYEMKDQLSQMGIDKKKLLSYEEYRMKTRGHLIEFHRAGNEYADIKKKILIVSTKLDYNGGSLAAVYAAKALSKRQYKVVLATPEGDACFVEETIQTGISVAICPALPSVTEEIRTWVQEFDAIIVNVFQMIAAACNLSMIKPTMWWIHECSSKYDGLYERIRKTYSEYDNEEKMSKIAICAVSSIAKDNFNYYYPNRIQKILPYGIPCEGKRVFGEKREGKIVFSVIGGMSALKNQKLLMEALKFVQSDVLDNIEIWFIGNYNSKYGKEVEKNAKEYSFVKLLGSMSRKEILHAMEHIDVVVCSSLEETMSITITEGMMLGKLCLATSNSGMASYITQGENGFVFESGDARDLGAKMQEILEKKDAWNHIRKKAMETYETYFSMDVFGERLEVLMEELIG